MTAESACRSEIFASLEQLPPGHRALLDDAPSFDQTGLWYEAFAHHLLQPHESMTVVALTGAQDRPIGVLPLRASSRFRGPLPLRSVCALSNYYTALFGPVFASGTDEASASRALVVALRQLLPRWNLFDLSPLAPEHPFFEACCRELRSSGCLVQPYFRFGNWYLQVRGRRFADYQESMPGRMRSTLARKSKKLGSRADVSIEIVRIPAEVGPALSAYESVYGKSWKQEEPHKEFIRDVVGRFAAAGWLRLGVVRIGGVPAAAQIWFVHRQVASIFKLAYDPAYTDLSVGSVLTMRLMEHVLDVDRVSTVDYLCGDDAYKRDWMSDRRERWGLRASPWLSLIGLTEVVQAVGSRLKRVALKGTSSSHTLPSGQAPA
jgi:hypothetical protein